jgi:RNA polymerase sigma-70 factor (family 1)
MQDHFNKDESLLVSNLSQGDIIAFNELYQLYSYRLYRFAFGYFKSEAEAEELVQDVFTKVWEKRVELKKELSFKSFLFTIAFNNIKKHFRAKGYLLAYLKNLSNNEIDTGTSDKISYDSLFKYIADLANQLPDKRRTIFIKSRLEGLSIKEIAETLKISHKTVENQLTDSLKFIRNNLKKETL